MADEIIAVLEYLLNNPAIRVAAVAYIVLSAIALGFVVLVFVLVLKRITKNYKGDKRR